MTDVQTILLSQLNRHMVGADMARDIDEVLIDRIRGAKREYRSVPRSELSSDVEAKRFELLNRISMLQSETFFKVSNDAALTQMIPNILIPYLIDQSAAAYEARSDRDLNVLELNLEQFQTVLNQAIGRTVKRGLARSYGIVGCIATLLAMCGFLWYGDSVGIDKSWIIPILSVPVTIVVWSLIGALAAMLYRYNKAGDMAMDDPLRWLFARPLTGVVMGMTVYLLIKGVLIVSGSRIPIEYLGSQEVMWLVAFLAGFSDRFCDFTLNLIVGRLGNTAMEPSAQAGMAASAPAQRTHRTFEMLDEMSMDRRRPMPVDYSPAPAPAPVPAAQVPPASVKESRPNPREEMPVPPPHQTATGKPAAKGKNGKD